MKSIFPTPDEARAALVQLDKRAYAPTLGRLLTLARALSVVDEEHYAGLTNARRETYLRKQLGLNAKHITDDSNDNNSR